MKLLRKLSREMVEIKLLKIFKIFSIVFFFIITVFPFYWMLNLSFRPYGDVLLDPSRMIPKWQDIQQVFAPLKCINNNQSTVCKSAISNSSFAAVLIRYNFLTFIRNSVFISGLTTIISLLLSVPAAYASTRLDFKGRTLVGWLIMLVYMFPSIVISIPLFVFFTRIQSVFGIQLRNPIGVTIIYLANTLPLSIHMLRGYFATIPSELEEAAMIDGSTRWGVIWKIVIPLAAPAIVSVALYVFMIAWNEFLYALLFLVDEPSAWTLPLGLQQLNSQEVPTTFLMAGSVIVSIPILVLFFLFEKRLTSGLTAGSVKG